MRFVKTLLGLVTFAVPSFLMAESIFDPQNTTRSRYTPDTRKIDDISDFQKKYQIESDKRRELEAQLQSLKDQLEKESQKQTVQTPSPIATPSSPPPNMVIPPPFMEAPHPLPTVVAPGPTQKTAWNSYGDPHAYNYRARKPMVFGISQRSIESLEKKTTIPAGSYVKVTILTGVEASANPQTPYPMLLQADYAFTGPNHTKIDMSNCFMLAKTNGDLSTERVFGQVDTISCVRDNGRYEERPTQGFLVGDDSTFGVIGQLISKQGQVLAAAVIASIAKGASEAVAAAQTTTDIVAGNAGAPASATNVTGNQAAYVVGRAFTDSAAMVADWYLKYAEQLVPAVAVGSGRTIWVVLQRPIEIPTLAENE